MNVSFVGLSRQYESLRSELSSVFDEVGRSGVYIMGEVLERFETEVAEFCGTRYALGVGNGSDALFLSMKALGIGGGDEVITCPNSFIATAWTIVATGAKPVFVDCAEDYNIDPEKILEAITSSTKAVIPTHLTGRPADVDRIEEVVRSRGIFVLEDAAQAMGARYKGRRAGSLGLAAGFSLHPLKNLGLYGDGGLVTTNDPKLYEKIRTLRNHGLISRDECDQWGYNSRLDSLQAAFGLIKLKKLDSWNRRCREIANKYIEGLKEIVWVPVESDTTESVYHNFVIKLDVRDRLIEHLNKHGVETRIHYPIPIHLQKCAKALNYKLGDFPLTEKHAKSMLSLPIYPELLGDEVEYVIDQIRNFFA